MSEEEIKLALECCSVEHIKCQTCPLFGDPFCHRVLAKNALSLIEKKNAEIERLQKYNTNIAFKHYNDGIKDFAERLNDKVHNYYPSIDSYCVSRKVVLIADIKNLLEEMRIDNG